MITFYRELGSRPDFRVREIRRVCAELEEVPVAPSGALRAERTGPLGFLSPVLDGQRTNYYEWHGAGHHRLGAGGSAMHRDQHLGRDLWFGFDLERLYVRRTSRTVCCRLPGTISRSAPPHNSQSIETFPGDDIVRFTVPDVAFESMMWSA